MLADADLLLGDYLARENAGFALGEWLIYEPAWQTALGVARWQKKKQQLMQMCDSEAHFNAQLTPLFQQIFDEGTCTPLFHYRYQINALENVQDMVLTAGGWLDFTRAWLPPPAS